MENNNKLLTLAELMYYLKNTFETVEDYNFYIKWLHNKINSNKSLKTAIVHVGNETVFNKFTAMLCSDIICKYQKYD